MAKRADRREDRSGPARPDVERPVGYPITTLDRVIGQAAAKRVLESAVASGRVHHAWVFHGAPGIGKFTTAIAFAAALLDPATGTDGSGHIRATPDSDIQRLIRTGNHPDLHVVTKELAAISREPKVREGKQITLATEVVREFLIDPAAKTRVIAAQGQPAAGKVFVVDEAELMNEGAQNALLKVLEEPPPGTVIILVTPSEERLRATIRSRCQRAPFMPLTESEMNQWLGLYLEGAAPDGTPRPRLTPGQRDWLLRFAAGSPGTAQLVLEQGLFAWHEQLGPMLDQVARGRFVAEFGPAMVKLIGERAEAVVKARPLASKDAANKAWARRMLSYIGEESRARLRGAAARPEARGSAAIAQLTHILDCVTEAEQNLGANVSTQTVFENFAAQSAAEPLGV